MIYVPILFSNVKERKKNRISFQVESLFVLKTGMIFENKKIIVDKKGKVFF